MKVYIVYPYYGGGNYGTPSCVYADLIVLKEDWPNAVDGDSDDETTLIVGGYCYCEMDVN